MTSPAADSAVAELPDPPALAEQPPQIIVDAGTTADGGEAVTLHRKWWVRRG